MIYVMAYVKIGKIMDLLFRFLNKTGDESVVGFYSNEELKSLRFPLIGHLTANQMRNRNLSPAEAADDDLRNLSLGGRVSVIRWRERCAAMFAEIFLPQPVEGQINHAQREIAINGALSIP